MVIPNQSPSMKRGLLTFYLAFAFSLHSTPGSLRPRPTIMKIKPSLIPFIKSFGLAVVSIFAICANNSTKLSAAGCCPLAISFPRTGPGARVRPSASVHTRVPLGANLKTKLAPKKVYFKCMQNPPRSRFVFPTSPSSPMCISLIICPFTHRPTTVFWRFVVQSHQHWKITNKQQKKTHSDWGYVSVCYVVCLVLAVAARGAKIRFHSWKCGPHQVDSFIHSYIHLRYVCRVGTRQGEGWMGNDNLF